MPYIYAITEKNVDGCGGDATEYVRFQCQIQPDKRKVLAHCLELSKTHAPEDSDTAGMIRWALDRFEAKTGIFGSVCESPVCDELSF